jgi:hypothetical protein
VSTTCEVCGQEDLFSYVTGEGVCATCTLTYGIPDKNWGQVRRDKIEAAKKLRAAVAEAKGT